MSLSSSNYNDNNINGNSKDDLDLFLTSVESRLRGPFSSLDLSKTIATNALRGESPTQYLQMMSKVISRTDKVIQLRMLIALTGLENDEQQQIVHEMLTRAQDPSITNEEWVRVVSGLIMGIMYKNNDHVDDNDPDSRCMGEEAKSLLDKTCTEIIEKVQEATDQSEKVDVQVGEEDGEQHEISDMNPCFAPYRLSLLQTKKLQTTLLADCYANPHCTVNTNADILQLDAKLEAQRAKESHHANGMHNAVSNGNAKSATAAAAASAKAVPTLAGFRPAKLVPTKGANAKARPKTNMFMPSKKPTAANPRLKTGLHTRKAGAAQALLAKKRAGAKLGSTGLKAASSASGGGGGGTSPVGGATSAAAALGGANANRLGVSNNKNAKGGRFTSSTRMKMIDVNEVDSLNKQRQSMQDKLQSRKRKIMEQRGQIFGNSNTKVSKVKMESSATSNNNNIIKNEPASSSSTTTTSNDNNNNNINTDTFANTMNDDFDTNDTFMPTGTMKQDPVSQQQPDSSSFMSHPEPSSSSDNNNNNNVPEWQILLQERSNKLSQDDRQRVQQFFQQNYNPTPEQTVYKMKLHEERTTDPATGQAIKETYYLELDYTTMTFKQSKKKKRY